MSVPVLLFSLLTASCLILAAWFAVETHLLRTKQKPVTWYTRRLVNEHWGLALVVVMAAMFVVGVSVTHFFIDAPCQPWS